MMVLSFRCTAWPAAPVPRLSQSTLLGNWPTSDKTETPRVCLLDLDLQFGTVSTYLDLPRREAVLNCCSDTEVDG